MPVAVSPVEKAGTGSARGTRHANPLPVSYLAAFPHEVIRRGVIPPARLGLIAAAWNARPPAKRPSAPNRSDQRTTHPSRRIARDARPSSSSPPERMAERLTLDHARRATSFGRLWAGL